MQSIHPVYFISVNPFRHLCKGLKSNMTEDEYDKIFDEKQGRVGVNIQMECKIPSTFMRRLVRIKHSIFIGFILIYKFG